MFARVERVWCACVWACAKPQRAGLWRGCVRNCGWVSERSQGKRVSSWCIYLGTKKGGVRVQ